MEDNNSQDQLNIPIEEILAGPPPTYSSSRGSNVASSFQFESGRTLSEETKTVYFVLEPTTDSEKIPAYAKKSPAHTETCYLLQTQNSSVNQNINHQSEIKVSVDKEKRSFPGITRTGVTKCLEPNCYFVCSRIPQLRCHLEEEHGIQQESKMFAFASENDFRSWLSAIEREARCTFMRRRGWQKNKNGSVTACFYCNRGGAYTSKATKKQIKAQGSCKTGVECTSSMKVTMMKSKNDDNLITQVQVEAYLQHYGHNLDLTHTRLTKTEKEEIARKLSSGVSRNKILDDVRSTLDASASPHRLHLLSLQDLYNIEKKEGIKANKSKGSNEEGTTVQAWIEKMQQSEDNPVLLIKYQQEKAKEVCSCLGDDDFILVLQTPLQAMMLRKYGPHQCICMDITKGDQSAKNEPNFYLMSLEVVVPVQNNCEEVFPVAWFVSNRKDKSVIEIFFSQIKKNLSDLTLTPSYLYLPGHGITGGCDWYQIWTSIFGPGPRKLLCSWHIIDEFKRFHFVSSRTPKFAKTCVDSATSSKMDITRLTSNLQTVLHTRAAEGFVQLMEQFVADLSKDPITFPYANFFKNNYISQPEMWSRAYRSEAHVLTEAKFEEYHQKIVRHIYIEGFKRKQLDVLIKILMRNSRDHHALHRLRYSYKHFNDATVRCMTATNHQKSTSLPTNFVSPHKVAVEYIVKCAEFDLCSARLMCAYRCEDCGICSHHFSCSCHGDQKNPIAGDRLNVLCEHCHLVVRYMHENEKAVDALLTAPTSNLKDSNFDPAPGNDEENPSSQIVVMVLDDEQEKPLNADESQENVSLPIGIESEDVLSEIEKAIPSSSAQSLGVEEANGGVSENLTEKTELVKCRRSSRKRFACFKYKDVSTSKITSVKKARLKDTTKLLKKHV